jgi:hypothetical protein
MQLNDSIYIKGFSIFMSVHVGMHGIVNSVQIFQDIHLANLSQM